MHGAGIVKGGWKGKKGTIIGLRENFSLNNVGIDV